MLAEVEERRRVKAEEQERIREEARERRAAMKKGGGQDGGEGAVENQMGDVEGGDDVDGMDEMDEDTGDDVNPMAALLASAKARAAEYDGASEEDEDEDEMDEDDEMEGLSEDDEEEVEGEGVPAVVVAGKENSRRAFDKVFKRVVEAADVVLYVLDARDPEGTRSKEVEREIMAADGGQKRLILILNKIDLVPPAVLKNWMIHLRRYFPALPLKSSNGAGNANSFDQKQLSVKGTSETLFRALKTYSQTKGLGRAISVGVIGYPNVGKSSVINALTSRLKGSGSACPTGAEAGVTTSLREVKLDSKLKLIDSPGIVFPSASGGGGENKKSTKKQTEQARLILLNAIPPKQIQDPIPAVSLLIKRLSSSEGLLQKLLQTYGIPTLDFGGAAASDQTSDFLVQVARKRGRLGKHGVPNVEAAAMTVVNDWRDGRIQGWATPPVLRVVDTTDGAGGETKTAPAGVDTRQVVSDWAAEFKIEGLWGDGNAGDENMEE